MKRLPRALLAALCLFWFGPIALLINVPALASPQEKAVHDRADILIRHGRFEEARQLLVPAVKAGFRNPILFCQIADSYILDDDASEQGLHQADVALQTALKIDPECGCAYRDLARLAIRNGKYKEATTWATRSVTCKEPDPTGLDCRAKANCLLHNDKAALSDVEIIVKRGHRSLETLIMKAQLLDRLGRYDEAVAAYRDVIALRNDWGRFQLAQCMTNHGNVKDAIAEVSEIIEHNREDDQAYATRGRLKAKLKDFKGALADYSEAIRLEPLSLYLRERANLYDRLGQPEQASKDRLRADAPL